MFVGPTNVGKTSIIARYVHDRLDPNQLASIGVAFQEIRRNVDGKEVLLKVWDTAGQERYRAVVGPYFRDVVLAVAVFDLSADTKESLEYVREWIERVQAASDPIILIIGNKTDLCRPSDKAVEAVVAVANDVGATFKFTSAVTGEGIDELFDYVARKVSERLLPAPSQESVSALSQESVQIAQPERPWWRRLGC